MFTPTRFSEDADLRLRNRAARTGWRRAVGALWHALHRSTDLVRLEEAAIRVQRPVSTGRRVAVTSSRGGAGRTTLAALLAQTYGRLRLEPIGAVDLDPGHGGLRLRLGSYDNEPRSADALEPSVEGTADAIAEHVRRHGTGGAADFFAPLTVSPHRVHHTVARTADRQLGTQDVAALLSAFSRFFPVTVTDCAAGRLSVETTTAVDHVHAVLHVVPADALALDEALALLDPRAGAVRAPLVVAVVHSRASSNARVRSGVAALEQLGHPVHHVPFDRHLDTGVSITPRMLLPRTRAVVAEIAADLLEASLDPAPTPPSTPPSNGSTRVEPEEPRS